AASAAFWAARFSTSRRAPSTTTSRNAKKTGNIKTTRIRAWPSSPRDRRLGLVMLLNTLRLRLQLRLTLVRIASKSDAHQSGEVLVFAAQRSFSGSAERRLQDVNAAGGAPLAQAPPVLPIPLRKERVVARRRRVDRP